MGTEKRERQKANRALKHQQLERQQRTQAVKRKGLRIGLLALLGLGGVFLIAWIGGAFDSDDSAGTITTDPAVTTAPPPVEPTECPPTDGSATQRRTFAGPPPMCIDPEVQYSAEFTTNFGDFTIELDAERAPEAVNNLVVLARYKYFDNTVCHRIIPDFVVQCGDPTGTGTGGPGYTFDAELPEAGEYQVGSVAMANANDPNTQGSQFFIVTGPGGVALPPQYTLFGQVTEGLDSTIPAMDAVGNPDPAAGGVPPLEEVRIAQVIITES